MPKRSETTRCKNEDLANPHLRLVIGRLDRDGFSDGINNGGGERYVENFHDTVARREPSERSREGVVRCTQVMSDAPEQVAEAQKNVTEL